MSTGWAVWKAFVRDPPPHGSHTALGRRKSGDKLWSCLCSFLAAVSFSGLQFLHQHKLGIMLSFQHKLGVMLGFVAPF